MSRRKRHHSPEEGEFSSRRRRPSRDDEIRRRRRSPQRDDFGGMMKRFGYESGGKKSVPEVFHRPPAHVPDSSEDDEFVEEWKDSDDEEAAEAERAAERRRKREVAKHQQKASPDDIVAADSGARTDEATERVEEEGTIQFKRTALGLVEERKDEASFDMFGDAALPATSPGAGRRRATAAQLEGDEEATNWDDGEGYYMARPGEMIDSKYKVLGVVGKGVFSSVLRATLTSDGTNVAVKMIRNNETMKKAAIREVEILRDLQGRDPDDRCHCVRLLDTTQHRNHTALVFESMAMNLRQALRKYGNDVGINIMAVQSYGRQLFGALRHLRRAGVVHADIKPDNVLVSENNSTVKLCDFGSGFKQDEDPMSSDPAPYLVSRFYRAPEIILGLKYDERIDLWSVSTCLYELYTGKVMFPGKDNNMMLAKMMDMKGRFPVRMLKNHVRVYRDLLLLEPHFQEVQGTYKFQQRTYVANNNNNGSSSASSAEARLNLVDIIKPKTSIAAQFMAKKAGADDVRSVQNLADLLELCCSLNPENRPSVSSDTVRKHPFFLLAS